jgi:hypothetical protein
VIRRIPIILIVLAVFYGIPRLACTCVADVAMPVVASSEHSCCHAANHCRGSRFSIGKVRGCCGMQGGSLPAMVGSSLELTSSIKAPLIKVMRLLPVQDQTTPASARRLTALNRAPPGETGLGSSDTYLFKRVLLI